MIIEGATGITTCTAVKANFQKSFFVLINKNVFLNPTEKVEPLTIFKITTIFKCFGHLSKGALYKITFLVFYKDTLIEVEHKSVQLYLQIIDYSRYACCMDLTRVMS
jgi:hypothetical protein